MDRIAHGAGAEVEDGNGGGSGGRMGRRIAAGAE